MRWRFAVIVLIAVILLAAGACKKEFNIDKWKPDMLMPFVKGTATIEDLSDLKDKIFIQRIPAFDIGINSVNVPVPVTTISLGYVGPYEYKVSDYFNYVDVDTASFTITLSNVFPVTINKGTRIDFRTEPDTSDPTNIVFTHTINEDVAPNTEYRFTKGVANKYVPSTMYMYLQNFKATNPNNGNIIFDPAPGTLTFEIKFLSINKAALNSSKELTITDTASIEFNDDTDINEYEDSAATGKLMLHLTNKTPINYNFQIYFFNEAMGDPIDSFYITEMGIAHATTDGVGDPTSVEEETFNLPLTAHRIATLKTAKFVSYKLSGNTNHLPPGIILLMNKKCYFEAQIAGDVKIKIASFLKFL